MEDPAVLYSCFQHSLAAILTFALASLFRQHEVFGGPKGFQPLLPKLQRARTDLGLAGAVLQYPTLLWFLPANLIILVGTICGCLASIPYPAVGLLYTPCLFVAWLCYLSMSPAMGVTLMAPWDSLLLETSFLTWSLLPRPDLFRVNPSALPPSPLAGMAFRWLLFRLMFGFGKTKFLEHDWRKDNLYMRGFFTNMPSPHFGGLLASATAPDWLLRLSLVIMFVTEIPIPFTFLLPASLSHLRALGGALTIALMGGITATGNFSHFNLLTALLCAPCFDPRPLWPAGDPSAPWSDLPLSGTLLLAVWLPLTLLCLLFNSWCSSSWPYWPSLQKLPLLRLARAVHPFRVAHSFGIFPPHSSPPVRWLAVFEGLHQPSGQWREYGVTFQTCTPRSVPHLTTPYQRRFDFWLFYASLGLTGDDFTHSVQSADPYQFSRSDKLSAIAQRLLERGSNPVKTAFSVNPFPDPDAPPAAVRARLWAFSYASLSQALQGVFWRRSRSPVLTVLPPTTADAAFWDRRVPSPLLFHWDQLMVWRHRSKPLMQVCAIAAEAAAASSGSGVSASVCESLGCADKGTEFWQWVALVQAACAVTPTRGHGIHGAAAAAAVADDVLGWTHARLMRCREHCQQRWPEPTLALFERVFGGLVLAAVAALEPKWAGMEAEVLAAVPSYFHLGLLASRLVSQGSDAYDRAVCDPNGTWAKVLAGNSTAAIAPAGAGNSISPEAADPVGVQDLGLLAFFWQDNLIRHASVLRLLTAITPMDSGGPLPGYLALIPGVMQRCPPLPTQPDNIPIMQRRGEHWRVKCAWAK